MFDDLLLRQQRYQAKQSFANAGYYVLGSNFDRADEIRVITASDDTFGGQKLLKIILQSFTLSEGLKKGSDINGGTKFPENFTPAECGLQDLRVRRATTSHLA